MYESRNSDDVDFFLQHNPDQNNAILFYDPMQEIYDDEALLHTNAILGIYKDIGEEGRSQEQWVDDLENRVHLMRVDKTNVDNYRAVDSYKVGTTPLLTLLDDGKIVLQEIVDQDTYYHIKAIYMQAIMEKQEQESQFNDTQDDELAESQTETPLSEDGSWSSSDTPSTDSQNYDIPVEEVQSGASSTNDTKNTNLTDNPSNETQSSIGENSTDNPSSQENSSNNPSNQTSSNGTSSADSSSNNTSGSNEANDQSEALEIAQKAKEAADAAKEAAEQATQTLKELQKAFQEQNDRNTIDEARKKADKAQKELNELKKRIADHLVNDAKVKEEQEKLQKEEEKRLEEIEKRKQPQVQYIPVIRSYQSFPPSPPPTQYYSSNSTR